MRHLRSLVVLGALAALAPRTTHAQAADRDFNNSWFWGVKAGSMLFWTTSVSHAPAPLIGAEWLITKRSAALYVSYDRTFFNEQASFPAYDYDGTPIGRGQAQIKDMNRVTAQLFAFPKRFGIMRPYLGGGMALNNIVQAQETGATVGGDVEGSIEDVKTRGSIIFTGGLQAQLSRVSVFGQGSFMPAKAQFFFNNGNTYFIEGGVRYNFGPARERR